MFSQVPDWKHIFQLVILQIPRTVQTDALKEILRGEGPPSRPKGDLQRASRDMSCASDTPEIAAMKSVEGFQDFSSLLHRQVCKTKTCRWPLKARLEDVTTASSFPRRHSCKSTFVELLYLHNAKTQRITCQGRVEAPPSTRLGCTNQPAHRCR